MLQPFTFYSRFSLSLVFQDTILMFRTDLWSHLEVVFILWYVYFYYLTLYMSFITLELLYMGELLRPTT